MMTFRRNALGVLTKQATTPQEIEAWSRIKESERRLQFGRADDDRLPILGDGSMKKAIRYDD